MSQKSHSTLCSISFSMQGFSFALSADIPGAGEQLIAIERFDSVASPDIEKQLQGLVHKYDIVNKPCVCVLHPSDYQLLLTERPNVSGEEMADALRWTVPSKVHLSAEQSLVQAFETSLFPNKVFACVVAKDIVVKMSNWLHSIGLDLLKITITELALTRIFGRVFKRDHTVGLVHFMQGAGLFLLIKNGQLLQVRKLPALMEVQSQWDQLVMQMKKQIEEMAKMGCRVEEIYFTPGHEKTSASLKKFEIALNCRVEMLDLSSLLASHIGYQEKAFSNCLSAVGGSFCRNEGG